MCCTENENLSRRQKRRLRRENKRLVKISERSKNIGTLDSIFSYDNLYKYGKKCCTGVRWKSSIQQFELHLFSQTAYTRNKIITNSYKWSDCFHFKLNERGKIRDIDAPNIKDRQVYKVITKEILIPLYTPKLIFNNGASVQGKGLIFTQKQLKQDLKEHFKKYGFNGNIILSDCKKFFPNANHTYIKHCHKNVILDDTILQFVDSSISAIKTNIGMPIGIEPSQMEMVHYPSRLDSYMTCQLGLKGYGHYMDDFYILVPPSVDAKQVLSVFIKKAEECCIKINKNKTYVLKFGIPFRFCKSKYTVLSTSKIVENGNKTTAKRFNNKLKAFKRFIQLGKMSYIDVWNSIQSTLSYYKKKNDNKRLLHLKQRFYSVFGFSCELYNNFLERDRKYDSIHLPHEL